MTEQQWEVELKNALVGTHWEIYWYGVLQQYPSCVADVHHRVRKVSAQIELSRDVFRTPETRKAEVLRQLCGI
jgi:hypothetical protein